MRKYELMVVVKSDFPHQDEGKRVALIEKLLTEQEFSNLKTDQLGKRELAYMIQKQTEGCYILANFEAKTIIVGNIEQQVKLSDTVLRYLLTNIE